MKCWMILVWRFFLLPPNFWRTKTKISKRTKHGNSHPKKKVYVSTLGLWKNMLGLPSIVYLGKKYLNISQPEISLERTWTNLVWLLFPCRVLAGYNWSNNSGGHISSSWKTIPDWLRIIHTWDTWWRRWYDQPSQVHGWSSDLWVLCDLWSWKETFWAVISDHTQPCPLRHHMSADFYTIFEGERTHTSFLASL